MIGLYRPELILIKLLLVRITDSPNFDEVIGNNHSFEFFLTEPIDSMLPPKLSRLE